MPNGAIETPIPNTGLVSDIVLEIAEHAVETLYFWTPNGAIQTRNGLLERCSSKVADFGIADGSTATRSIEHKFQI